LFTFSCYSSPPPLPSFPTRRSSDLVGALRNTGLPRIGFSEIAGGARKAPAPHLLVVRGCRRFTEEPAQPLIAAVCAELDRRGRRSEEHTSELQSLTNLVCRLLLEKK